MNEKTVDKVYCDFCGSELASQDALHSIADCAFYLLKRVNELVSRNSELEAEIAELKPYRDGYDPEKAFPPAGEWVWLRDCDDQIEPVQYDYKAGFYWNYGTNPDSEPFWYWEPDNGDLVRWYPIGKLPEERKK